jgi:hypothetical protein
VLLLLLNSDVHSHIRIVISVTKMSIKKQANQDNQINLQPEIAQDVQIFSDSVENNTPSYETFLEQTFAAKPALKTLYQNKADMRDALCSQYAKLNSPVGDSTPASTVAVVSRAVEPASRMSDDERAEKDDAYLRWHMAEARDKAGISTNPVPFGSVASILKSLETTIAKSIQIDYSEVTVRHEPEISRLAMALDMGPEDRIHNIARTIGYIYNEDGKVIGGRDEISRKELFEALQRFGITYHHEHFNRIIRQGTGVFWGSSRTHIYIRSRGTVGVNLTQIADAEGLEAVYTNPPGAWDMLIPVAGSIERYYGHVYASWLSYRSKVKLPKIARSTLSTLFNRTDEQLRNYEKEHLVGTLKVDHTTAQTTDVHLTDESFASSITTTGETLYVKRWSNTYESSIRQHESRGQARKTRRKVEAVYSDSQSIPKEATDSKIVSRFNRRILTQHFELGGKTPVEALEVMNRAAKQAEEHGIEVFLDVGQNTFGHNILEISDTGYAVTDAFTRVPVRSENRHFYKHPEIYQENQRRYAYSK